MDSGKSAAGDRHYMKVGNDTPSASDAALEARQQLLQLRLKKRSTVPSSAAITRRRDLVPSRVSFAQEVKTHDGLVEQNELAGSPGKKIGFRNVFIFCLLSYYFLWRTSLR